MAELRRLAELTINGDRIAMYVQIMGGFNSTAYHTLAGSKAW